MLNTVIQVVPDFKQFRIINIKINRGKRSSFCVIFCKIKVVFIAETLAIKRESLAGLIFRIQSRSFRTQNTSATLNVIQTCCPESCQSVDLLLNGTYFVDNVWIKSCDFVFLMNIFFLNFVSAVE